MSFLGLSMLTFFVTARSTSCYGYGAIRASYYYVTHNNAAVACQIHALVLHGNIDLHPAPDTWCNVYVSHLVNICNDRGFVRMLVNEHMAWLFAE